MRCEHCKVGEAYVGMSTVECSNKDCKFYVQGLAPEEPTASHGEEEPCCYGMCVAGNQHSSDCTKPAPEYHWIHNFYDLGW